MKDKEREDVCVWQVSAPVHVAMGKMQSQRERLDESLRQQPQADRGQQPQQQQQQRVPVVRVCVRAPALRPCQRTGLGCTCSPEVDCFGNRVVNSCFAPYKHGQCYARTKHGHMLKISTVFFPMTRPMPDEVHKVKRMSTMHFDFVKFCFF